MAISKQFKYGAVLLSGLVLSACSTTGPVAELSNTSRGFSAVQVAAKKKTGKDSVWIQNQAQADKVSKRVHSLIHKKTINADTAVQVALLSNKGLQAAYAEVGLSAADVWQEALPENPTLIVETSGVGVSRAIETLIAANIASLITRNKRVNVAEAQHRRAQLVAVAETLRVAGETRAAWIKSVSAWEQAAHIKNAVRASEAGSELALQLGRTGAIPKAAQAREHANYADITARLARAKLMARGAKRELARTMGVWGQETEFFVPNSLPNIPRRPKVMKAVASTALRNRVDLMIAHADLEILARNYGLVNVSRFVSDLVLVGGTELGRAEDGGNEVSGRIDLDFAIPIFDTGKARLRKAELAYMRAANILAQKAVNVRSEAQTAYGGYRGQHDIVRHYQTSVLPLHRTLEEQALLNNNGMITYTFELLADVRAKLNAELEADRAKRDFWLADLNLEASVYGPGPSDEDEEEEDIEIPEGGEEEEA